MSTIANCLTSGDDEWSFKAKMICKRIYHGPSTKRKHNKTHLILTLVLIDADGQTIELKSWNREKIFCVYRKVNEDISYQITGSGELTTPDSDYSNSDYETYSWWIDEIEDIRLRKYLTCSSDVQKVAKSLKQGNRDNVLGVYTGDTYPGPKIHYIPALDKYAVEGHFFRLQDESGQDFYVLVWHSTRIDKSKFALFHCEAGDTILVNSVRKGYPSPDLPDGDKLLTLTSIYPPVVESECISNRRKRDLKHKYTH